VGALIAFRLAAGADELSIRLVDERGTAIRELNAGATRQARRAGLHRVVWDLRSEPVPVPRFQRGGGSSNLVAAPSVMPGTYRAVLVVDGEDVASTPVSVKGDPAIQITDTDLRMQHETAVALHGLVGTANRAADAVYSLAGQLEEVRKLAGLPAERNETLEAAMQQMATRLRDLRRYLSVPDPVQGGGAAGGGSSVRGTVTSLRAQIMGSTSRPTETQLRQMREAREDLGKVVEQVNEVISDGMPKLLSLLGGTLVPAVRETVESVR
jgi:hypothetical protein